VVHQAFTDETEMAAGRARRSVAYLDHARRLGAAGVDGEQAPAAHLHQLLLVEHLDVHAARVTERDREAGDARRVEMAVRRVGEITGELRNTGEQTATLRPRSRVG